MTRSPRLLFVANVAWFFASHRLSIARAAREAGYDVRIAAGDAGADAIVSVGLPFHPLPVERGMAGLAVEWELFRSLTSLYRSWTPDIVHHVTLKPVLYGSLAARRVGVPWLVNAISGLGTLELAQGVAAHLRRRVTHALLRLGCDRPNCRVIFQNAEDRAVFESQGIVRPERSVLIPGSGVDLRVYQPSPEPSGLPVVMLPARLIRDKGIAEFVQAAKLLRARDVSARFVLVGGLDPCNATAVAESVLQQWLSDGAVEWQGHRTDMERAFSEASIVCLPSYREGMPKALLEAAACARPIVTTDTPGCRDCVEPGRSGLLVPARDASALADALHDLLEHPMKRRAFGAAGRELAERAFGVQGVIDRHLKLYRSLQAP